MKRTIFGYLFFILYSFTVYSQSNDSLKHVKVKFFISGGVNARTYYSNDAFFKYLYNKTPTANPRVFSTFGGQIKPQYSLVKGSVVPQKFIYNNLSSSSIINIGMELSSRKSKQVEIIHLIEVSYMKFSDEYSGSVYYAYESTGTNYGGGDVNDTVHAQ